MSVVGFDIGNENCVIAVAKGGKIDVLLNDESKRETPAVVSFGEKQRFLGSAGAAFATKNLKSTICQIKRLIGRPYKEPSVQEDLRLLPFKTSEGPHGAIWIHIQNLNQEWIFLPVEILGMLFAHLKQVTEKNLASTIEDCVIGIPSYFTDLQRREYLNAASIAGLRPWRLLHDCTAVALGYGMYKTDFSNKGPTNVMFVDVGQCDTQVTVAAFEKRGMKILSHSFDQDLGGRDFDDVLYRHFATPFEKEYGIDVSSSVRASLRLRASCEKLKKVLSANAEAPLNIECLINDKDVTGFIKREEFENLSMGLLERITNVCFKAVDDSGLRAEKIHCIELVGSGSRIPAITRTLTSLFGKEPMRTLNGSECVARGCALYCAMLSPALSVPDYKVEDIFPYSIGLYFDDGRHPEITPFPKGSPIPSKETVTYHGNNTFYCEVSYTNKLDFPSGVSPIVGRFMICPHQNSGAQNVDATVNVQLNMHGIFEIKSASFVEVIRPLLGRMVSAMSNTFMRNDAADHKPAGSSQSTAHHAVEPRRGPDRRNDVADHKPAGSSQSTAHHAVEPRRGPGRWNDAADHKPAGSSQSTAHHAVEPKRGADRKQKLAVLPKKDCVFTTTDELDEAKRRAQVFAEQDIKAEQTKEKRNTLESFIYDNRSKLLSSYRSVATDSEVAIISKSLQDTEDWLYKEGDDESEQAYIRKLEDLKKLLDPIENIYKEENEKKEATKALQTCIQEKRSAADLLSPSQKQEGHNECSKAEDWLDHLLQLQDSFGKNATPVYFSSAINGITQALKRRCKDITSKPSLPKYDEPVESDQKQSLDDMQCDN